jgi:type IX secretion system PorP/SprF family membrane protein
MFKINSKLLFFLFSQLLGLSLMAQQEAFYSVFWNNTSTYNPATTGEQSKYYGAINYRNQWDGLTTPGYPRSFSALFELNLDTINSAFGINYSYDQLGLEKGKTVGFNYSYHFDLPNDQKIGIGIGPTYSTKHFEISQFRAIDDFTQDPSIPNSDLKYHYFDLNAGVSYLNKKFNSGISVTQLLESDGGSQNQYKNTMHLFGHLSYKLSLTDKFKFIPKVRFATDLNSRVYEASLIAKYNDRYWIGGSYRSEIALGIMTGIDIAKKVRIGYALDYYNNNSLDINFGGSHEIVFALILD